LKKSNRIFTVALYAFLAVLVAGFILPSEGEAATKRVRRATVRRGSTTPQTSARGVGTQKNPHVIRTAAQLSAFAASVNGGNTYAGQYVKLGADIDLRDVPWNPIGIYKDGNTRPFKGFFDGAGFSILNMGAGNNVRPPTALFGALDGATIDGVNLHYIEVLGDTNVGGLVGFLVRSELKNCSVSGNVKGQSAVGGIVGSSLRGTMQNCNFSGNVVGKDGVGGLIGAANQMRMRSCVVKGQVEGNSDVGGFAGGVLDGAIMDCFADAVTVKGDRNVGGIVGSLIDNSSVNKSTFKGQIFGNSNVGGVAGRMAAGELLSCTVNGSINGRVRAGGIVGELADGKITRSTSGASVNGVADIGGLAGRMSGGELNHSANNGMISGGEAVGGLVGSYSRGNLNLESNKNTGSVKGYHLTDRLVGVQAR